MRRYELKLALCTAVLTALGASATAPSAAASGTALNSEIHSSATRTRFIVEAANAEAARRMVSGIAGAVEQNLDIIHGVTARLTAAQVAQLRVMPGVRVYQDRALTTQSSLTSAVVTAASNNTTLTDGTGVETPALLLQTDYTMETGASTLQAAGNRGQGVTIAVLDTGLWMPLGQAFRTRVLATRNVVNGGTGAVTGDAYGHGTHITSIAAGGAMNIAGGYFGIAPQANLVIVQAFNGMGAGRYADVIAGLDWIVANKSKYNIRVLNLSFGAPPQSDYWDDPVNQAVMADAA